MDVQEKGLGGIERYGDRTGSNEDVRGVLYIGVGRCARTCMIQAHDIACGSRGSQEYANPNRTLGHRARSNPTSLSPDAFAVCCVSRRGRG